MKENKTKTSFYWMTAYKIRYVLDCNTINLRMFETNMENEREKEREYKIAVVYVLRMEKISVVHLFNVCFISFPHWECLLFHFSKNNRSHLSVTDVDSSWLRWVYVEFNSSAPFQCICAFFLYYCPCLFTKWLKPSGQFDIIAWCRWPWWCWAKIRCRIWFSGTRWWCCRVIFVAWRTAKCRLRRLLFNATVKYSSNYWYWDSIKCTNFIIYYSYFGRTNAIHCISVNRLKY